MSDVNPPSVDFFISYTGQDEPWAEWIAWVLQESKYSVRLQAWDFGPGSNFVIEMDKAVRESAQTLLVLSNAFMQSKFTPAEWAAAFAQDPTGARRTLIPVRVEDCSPDGLLGQVVYIDLVNKPEAEAKHFLLQRLRGGRPTTPPKFPGSKTKSEAAPKPGFPPAEKKPEAPRAKPTTWTRELKRQVIETLASAPEMRSSETRRELVSLALHEQPERDRVLAQIRWEVSAREVARQLVLNLEGVNDLSGRPMLALILEEVVHETLQDTVATFLREAVAVLTGEIE